MKIQFKDIEVHATGGFDSAGDAIQHVHASGFGVAVLIDGQPLVISEEDAHRLEAAGLAFAYLGELELPDGSWRVVTIPTND